MVNTCMIPNSITPFIHDLSQMVTKPLSNLITNNCFRDMLAQEIYPNFKEITEALAPYHYISRRFRQALKNPFITVVAVGDGCTPRVGAMFAYRSKWKVYSVDPAFKKSKWVDNTHGIDRLTCITSRVENIPKLPKALSHVLLVAVHSHADLTQAYNSVLSSLGRVDMVYSMPCCVKQELCDMAPSEEYEDFSVISPKRHVKIWNLS